VFADLGASVWLAYAQTYAGLVELLAGSPAAAEQELLEAYAALEAAGARTELSNTAAHLAEAWLAQGRLDDAEEYARRSQVAASGADSVAQAAWRRVLARVLAARGDVAGAESVAREAVTIAAGTDALEAQADAVRALAGVLLLAHEEAEAAALLEEALALYEAKGNVVAADRLRAAVDGKPAESHAVRPAT
jgi:tetratricopeptide (TPR) repeat protein